MHEERPHDLPPVKRQRIEVVREEDVSVDDLDDSSLVRRHPLGLRPAGNALTTSVNLKTSFGLFAYLPDELISQFLEYLDPATLLRLGGTCRGLYAFTRNEELWRALFVE
jgi:hypothetical protein